jgi:YVTN family beta-propeller protein
MAARGANRNRINVNAGSQKGVKEAEDFSMHRFLVLPVLCLLGCAGVAAQTPQATELPGKPFVIKKTWIIGGEGNWDYITLDPVSLQLYIAHGSVVQVVDVSSGKVAGVVTGMRDAHEIALDSNGQYGYVSDGPTNDVKVFDRESLEVVAKIPTGKNPRAIVFEPTSRLVFVVCPATAEEARTPRGGGAAAGTGPRMPTSGSLIKSTVTVIDADTQKPLADLMLPGKLGFAQTDGKGRVYVNITDRNQIVHFNAQTLDSLLHKRSATTAPDGPKANTEKAGTKPDGAPAGNAPLTIDWSNPRAPNPLHNFRLGQDCQSPKGLAIDSANERLFTACDNMKMQVLNSANGQLVATLPIGAGTDAVGYDASRGLIYASNGGGVGSLTIIRQHLTDSYAVIQELPTQARARTLAVNPVSGEVYLVTNVTGFDLTHSGGIGGLKAAAVPGSFQVLEVGN